MHSNSRVSLRKSKWAQSNSHQSLLLSCLFVLAMAESRVLYGRAHGDGVLSACVLSARRRGSFCARVSIRLAALTAFSITFENAEKECASSDGDAPAAEQRKRERASSKGGFRGKRYSRGTGCLCSRQWLWWWNAHQAGMIVVVATQHTVHACNVRPVDAATVLNPQIVTQLSREKERVRG